MRAAKKHAALFIFISLMTEAILGQIYK